MKTFRDIRHNKPLELLLKSGGITAGGIVLALVVGLSGFMLVGHRHKVAWAESSSTSYTYTSGNNTVTVTSTGSDVTVTENGVVVSGPAMPAMPEMPDTSNFPTSTATPIPESNPVPAANKLGLNDPAADVAPSADFPNACYTTQQSQTCDTIALENINRARAAEGLGPMILPDYYASLPLDQQVIVVTNIERTDRGLSAVKGPDQLLQPLAQAGAQNNADPTGPNTHSWASNWAGGEASALAMDFSLMYDDGIGSNNIDCSAQNPGGCWGHRHNILVNWPNVSLGVGVADVTGWVSITQLFVQNW